MGIEGVLNDTQVIEPLQMGKQYIKPSELDIFILF